MSTAVTTIANKLAVKLGMGEVGAELTTTLKATAFKGNATDAQFMALLIVANQYGLNPWTREIYAFPDRQNGIVPVVGVDGWARILNEHPQFDGMEFNMPDDGSECTCIIYRKDRSHPISVTEYFSECRRDNAQPWKTHPKRMLRHKSMIQAARLAFGFVGIYDQDEAERIVEKDITPDSTVAEIAKQLPYCTGDNFEKNKQAWADLIVSGKKTQEGLISQLETKYLLTDEQKATIEKLVKDAGVTDAEFTTEYENAESENK